MKVKKFGEVVLCKDITFKDSGRYDLEQGHPGIVLLPTNEEDEYAYCIFMTSDKKRASEDKEKYIKYCGKSVKESYLNLQQIVKVKNNADKSLSVLNQEQFKEILNSFYNYQVKLELQDSNFITIKEKLKILLNMLEMNQTFEINEDINCDTINDMLKYKNIEKIKQMYCIKLMLLPDSNKEKILEEGFKTEKARNYAMKILEIYKQINKMDFSKIDLSDQNNPLRNLYFECMNKNYLMGAESIFTDVSTLLLNNKKKISIDIFLQQERELNLKRQKYKEEKRKGRLQLKINKANGRKEKRKIIGEDDEKNRDNCCNE